MAVITTGAHPKALWPGIRAWWGNKYDEYEKEYPMCFEQVDSDKAFEEDVQSTSFGLVPVKNQGSSTAYDSHQQGPVTRYTNVTYALGYIVTLEERQDNLYESVSMKRSAMLAFSVNQTVETVCANIYNRAFNSSYTGGDGVELISNAHPLTNGGTASNYLATPADLSESALEDLIIQISLATNDRGLKISLRPRSLHIHPSEMYNATRILKSVLKNDTADNAINALRAMNAIPDGVHVNHYFTDTDAWFVRTNCPDGLKLQWRQRPTFNQDNDFDTENAKAKSYMRFVPGWTDWRQLYGSEGAA